MGIDVRWQGLSSHSHPTSSTADFFPAATFGVSAVRAEVVRSMARITWKGDLAMNEAKAYQGVPHPGWTAQTQSSHH
jgi:hypothetical protein